MLSQITSGVLSVIVRVPFVLISIVIHELAHGFVAYKMGDPTAKRAGRLSLNPFKHIDPLGALCMLFFRFGWAKPVPVNPNYFRRKKAGIVLVSLAGPAANILFAFFVMILLYLSNGLSAFYLFSTYVEDLYLINLSLAVFNLIPIPPLDGSKVLGALLPEAGEEWLLRYERYGMILLFVLVFASGRWNPLGRILSFGVNYLHRGIFFVVDAIFHVF